jgi:hypothetical protein
VIGKKDTEEMEESDKYLRCLPCMVSRAVFILPISGIGLISRRKKTSFFERNEN